VSAPVTIVGSGASGVHAAQTLLDRGLAVRLIDVGFAPEAPPEPDASFEDLKDRIGDPYFLGADFRGVMLPGTPGEYYGFPPSKDHVFRSVAGFRARPEGFAPLLSFAQGGLAEAWTGGCYPYTAAELEGFGMRDADMMEAYALVARRIGVTGRKDDLEPFVPLHDHLLPPLELDAHSRHLMQRYEARRGHFHERLRARLGHSRVAVLSRDQDGRRACDYRGRCLFGCPREALYSPIHTLRACQAHPRFEYLGGRFVECFLAGEDRRVRAVVVRPAEGPGTREEIPADRLVLAAGTLSTARIVLESWRRRTGECRRLTGLMDNRQVLMPFLTLARLGARADLESYQYHQIAVGLLGEDGDDLHGQITTLKTALVHPIVSSLPLGVAMALRVFRRTHAALGLLNANFSDMRRESCYVQLDSDGTAEGGTPPLVIHYEPPPGEAGRLREGRRRFARVLRALGAVVAPGLTHVRPMGASVHYAGTLPVSPVPAPFTTSPDGRSHDFGNLWIVDGSVFTRLSAKQLTFTMMANATRVAMGIP
jgi:choline dehydrogenase-like flavoprotein